jgi:site-specific recombinase XerD
LDEDSAFFANKFGGQIGYRGLLDNFRRLCLLSGIVRKASRRQPCLHDLRHTFAHDRLVSWYRSGADVQRLLPHLSTFLGHKDISGTQRYLSMTPELLQEANRRFERYALTEVNHVK